MSSGLRVKCQAIKVDVNVTYFVIFVSKKNNNNEVITISLDFLRFDIVLTSPKNHDS